MNAPDKSEETILEVRNLRKHYNNRRKTPFSARTALKAVDDVSFSVRRGETLGIVGESGCGKSTLGRTLVRLHEPTSGSIRFKGEDISRLGARQLKAYRKSAQMIFQDPLAALNPWMKIGELIAEPMRLHRTTEPERIGSAVVELLEKVGLGAADLRKHSHEFSGGQLQRICIARALALKPEFIVCDEPVSALDVSIQSQILNLLTDLQREMGLTLLFISHNFAVIRHISDRIAVMYLGRIVEMCAADELFARPSHPYTRMLLASILPLDPATKRVGLADGGELDGRAATGAGCKFYGRCAYRTERCRLEEPQLRPLANGHYAACHQFV